MKKLLIAMATLMVGQAQAGLLNTEKDFLKTTVRCIAKDDVNVVYFKTLKNSGELEMLDYTFMPQMVGENKVLLVKQKGQEDLKELQFGDSGSSAITLPITMNDGEVFYCNIKLEILPAN